MWSLSDGNWKLHTWHSKVCQNYILRHLNLRKLTALSTEASAASVTKRSSQSETICGLYWGFRGRNPNAIKGFTSHTPGFLIPNHRPSDRLLQRKVKLTLFSPMSCRFCLCHIRKPKALLQLPFEFELHQGGTLNWLKDTSAWDLFTQPVHTKNAGNYTRPTQRAKTFRKSRSKYSIPRQTTWHLEKFIPMKYFCRMVHILI